MAKSYEDVVLMRNSLKDDYLDRHEAHNRLRKFWHGRYWENTEADTAGIASIFRDLTARQSDIGPDIKLTFNVLKDVCVKFQAYLAPVPMISCYVDPPSTETRRNQTTKKERYLYGTWSENNMNKVLSEQGWYLPLMGDAWLGIYPDFDAKICRTLLRSPEFAYPLMNWDTSAEDGVIFSWNTKRSAAARAFPNWSGTSKSIVQRNAFGKSRPKSSDPEVEVLEYSDRKEFSRWIDGERVAGVEHNFGFDLFEHVKFINVPGEPWGHGAVEQAVNLVEMGNAYLSLMMQSAIENVFPVMVLEDPMKMPEQLQRGAGAVIPVNAGGKVSYLTPPAGNLIAQSGWAQQITQMIKQSSSMSDSNFGEANNSIITGKAINELQGAGAGTIVEMVQGVSIGSALSSWNSKCIDIGRIMFKDDTIRLFGTEAAGLADLNPKRFSMNIKGSELVGSTRNDVVFMPYMDMQQKVVIGLQLAGAGLVSKNWQRQNVGIPDSEAMEEEIVSETIESAVLQLIVQSITDPDSAATAEESAVEFIEGGHAAHPLTQLQPPPMPGSEGPPGGSDMPIGPANAGPGPGGEVQSPPLNLPPGSPVPGGTAPPVAPQASAAPGGSKITLDKAIQAFQSLQGLTGKVYLVGEIVQTGETSDVVAVDITADADRDVVARGVQFPVQIKVIPAEPNEPYIEVTPGANPVMKGQMPEPEAAE